MTRSLTRQRRRNPRDKSDRAIGVRFNQAEHGAVEQMAKDLGMTNSDLLRAGVIAISRALAAVVEEETPLTRARLRDAVFAKLGLGEG